MTVAGLSVDDKHGSNLLEIGGEHHFYLERRFSNTYHSTEGIEYKEDAYLLSLITQQIPIV